ncbi:MAG: NRDE family protein [Acidobacteria bacterium]|nr:NRDE family protein [Acidobacteriota bacterium]
MCTLSWIVEADGYALLFNRDERRSRQLAEPPRIDTAGGVRFVAPRDGDAGGTWIFVNEAGVAACLLNLFRDHPFPPGEPPVSRGRLVLDLAGAPSAAAAGQALEGTDLTRYQPFTLALFGRDETPRALRWDGTATTRFQLDAQALPLTSSGRDADGVARSRRGTLARLAAQHGGLTLAALDDFHRSHHPDRGPYSPCMHREEAETVSLTTITVQGTAIQLTYQPGAPCEGQPVVTVRLAHRG